MFHRNSISKFAILFVLLILSGENKIAGQDGVARGGVHGAAVNETVSIYRPKNVQYGQLEQQNLSDAIGWSETFESEAFENGVVSWKLLHHENAASLLRQQRSPVQAQQGRSAEELQLSLSRQSCLILGHSLGFSMLIEDLRPTLCVKSDSPSNQLNIVLGAQIVLPYSIHPETGRPISFVVMGERYSGSGEWEKLGFVDERGRSNLLSEANRIAGMLRFDLKLPLDLRDRYVRQIFLFCESEADRTVQHTIRTDTLEVRGYAGLDQQRLARYEARLDDGRFALYFDPVNYEGFKLQAASHCVFLQAYSVENPLLGSTNYHPSVQNVKSKPLIATSSVKTASQAQAGQRLLYGPNDSVRLSLTNSRHAGSGNPSPASFMNIRMSERRLTLNDVPIGVRAIEYQGEPLAFLRKLEFNTVWINGYPSAELLREAADAGVWLICSPPESSQLTAASVFTPGSNRDRYSNSEQIDSIYDNVLAWNLGAECTESRHQSDAQRVETIKNADRLRQRPILCTARSGIRSYSRIVDILMLDRQPMFGSLDLVDLEDWQRNYPSLARPNTPFWSFIQTDPDRKLADQWTLYGGNVLELCPMTHEQLKMQVYRALAVGTHGLVFRSNTPLTGNDPATEYRKTSLELMNWELQMLERWFAAGRRSHPNLIQSSLKGRMSCAVLEAGRTRLLLPIWQERNSQFAIGGAVEGPLHYIVSGIPETYDAYLLTPGRLFRLNSERVAGGMKVELDEANLNTLVYFGEDDDVYGETSRLSTEIGPRAAWLACRLAELQLASTKKIFSQLKQAKDAGAIPIHPRDNLPLITLTEQESLINETKRWIDRAKLEIDQNPPAYAMAYLQAERSTRGLRATGRDLLRNATRYDLNPCMTPVSVSFATLPLYLAAYQRTQGARPEPTNRLPSGDMENATLWQQSGWISRLHRVDGIAPPVLEIAMSARRNGQNGLRMIVRVNPDEEAPKQLETAPLFVLTPQIPLKMGEMICVDGWIRIPEKLQSTVDGLMIYDSLGDEALSLRFVATRGDWRQFAFYRYVPADCNYAVCFSLNGIGEVHLDDLRIFGVQFETPRPAEVAPQPTAPSTWQRINPFNYLPTLPNWGQQ